MQDDASRKHVSARIDWSTRRVFGGLPEGFDDGSGDVPPRSPEAAAAPRQAGFGADFFKVFAAFFNKPDIARILAFLLLYRFAEAQLLKLVVPFLLDAPGAGGLGLKTQDVGIAYGTVGVAALTVGGLLGGWVISRAGLQRTLWPLMLCMHLPNALFVWMAATQPDSLWWVSAALAVEQFGYGFGFTAYMVFMLMVAGGADGNAVHKTAHYALCTGFMALGMMLPGMWSGWLQAQLGYQAFFVWACVATLPSFAAAALVRIDPGFGRDQTLDELIRGHFQREDPHRAVVLHRGGIGKAQRQRRFAEARTGCHDDQIRSLEAARELVEITETGRNPDQGVSLLAALAKTIEKSFEDFIDLGEFLGHAPLGDAEDAALGLIERILDFEVFAIADAHDLRAADRDRRRAHLPRRLSRRLGRCRSSAGCARGRPASPRPATACGDGTARAAPSRSGRPDRWRTSYLAERLAEAAT